MKFEVYAEKFTEKGWHPNLFNQQIAEGLKRRGLKKSHAPFIKAALSDRFEHPEGPLAGMEPFKFDAYELLIISKFISGLIDQHLLDEPAEG